MTNKTSSSTPLSMQSLASLGKKITLVLLAILLAHFIFDYMDNRTTGAILLIVKILPLLPVLPGMLRNMPRAYIWLCFMLLLYFLVAVQHALDPGATRYDYTLLALITLLFTSAMMTARWLARSTHLPRGNASC